MHPSGSEARNERLDRLQPARILRIGQRRWDKLLPDLGRVRHGRLGRLEPLPSQGKPKLPNLPRLQAHLESP
ncbi:hypothetical protein L596_021729 [Steinernema carpocapsae]|uniref:Uncharacterized protein n=1 Tax=Steinernema carpocapsae TaxID=34508 RepID=A0A4U5MJL4_STECR|nr:hypothetical protein L596_021729 [Steinernema carpocapsae]